MNNPSIEYSKEALEVKSLFYSKRFSVYVEGEEDVIFWESLFKISGYEDIYIEDVGGYSELIPYMNKIVMEDAKILVAADSDHRDLVGFDFDDERIIRTYGYSIENSMYSIQRIYSIIKKLSRNKFKQKEEISKWRIKFSEEARKLIVYSIANNLFDKGVIVFGDKCSRFLKDDAINELCSNKIEVFLNELERQFTKDEIRQASILLEKSTKETWFLIKGHFLTNGVLNHIALTVEKTTGKKPYISLDALYAMCADNEEINNKNDMDVKQVILKIENAINRLSLM